MYDGDIPVVNSVPLGWFKSLNISAYPLIFEEII